MCRLCKILRIICTQKLCCSEHIGHVNKASFAIRNLKHFVNQNYRMNINYEINIFHLKCFIIYRKIQCESVRVFMSQKKIII